MTGAQWVVPIAVARCGAASRSPIRSARTSPGVSVCARALSSRRGDRALTMPRRAWEAIVQNYRAPL
jgi:hypothetical protein